MSIISRQPTDPYTALLGDELQKPHAGLYSSVALTEKLSAVP